MTSQDSNSILTMTLIRRAGRTALGISYDFTSSGISTQDTKKLQSLIDPAVLQWWNGLTSFQRSALPDLQLSLKISASSRE